MKVAIAPGHALQVAKQVVSGEAIPRGNPFCASYSRDYL
jgi:hypothetical protein